MADVTMHKVCEVKRSQLKGVDGRGWVELRVRTTDGQIVEFTMHFDTPEDYQAIQVGLTVID